MYSRLVGPLGVYPGPWLASLGCNSFYRSSVHRPILFRAFHQPIAALRLSDVGIKIAAVAKTRADTPLSLSYSRLCECLLELSQLSLSSARSRQNVYFLRSTNCSLFSLVFFYINKNRTYCQTRSKRPTPTAKRSSEMSVHRD